MIQLEEVEDLPHRIYDKLIRGNCKTVEKTIELGHERLIEILGEEDAEILRKVIVELPSKKRSERVAEIVYSEEIQSLEGAQLTVGSIIAATIHAYENKYGVGRLVKSQMDDGTCACGIDRTECLKNLPCAQKP